MNLGEPFGGIISGARGAALDVLLRSGGSLTGRRVHALAGGGHSLGAVQQALRDLERLGLISTETVGRAGVHSINEAHVATAPLRTLRSPLDMLRRVVEESTTGVAAVIVFGSVARGEAHADSDVDLAVIADADWEGRAELAQAVQDRLGNDCDVLLLTEDELSESPRQRQPVVSEILRDGVVLVGEMPGRSPEAAR
jgi:predicted nucleotidyltransferase